MRISRAWPWISPASTPVFSRWTPAKSMAMREKFASATMFSNADGDITLKGALRHTENIVADANFSRMAMDFAGVHLENTGVVHFRTSRDSLDIEPVTFQGKDTNLQIAGAVQFAGRRTMGLRLNGGLDLRL